jgi:hypothetical protein
VKLAGSTRLFAGEHDMEDLPERLRDAWLFGMLIVADRGMI